MVLTNSSLSSIPIYTLGMFKLREEVHHKVDTIRLQFFWRGASDKFKYHMIKWEQLCVPKYHGGVGIINTRILNDALLLKWVWKMLEDKIEDLCSQLLKAKYCKNKPFVTSKGNTGSQFWKGVPAVRYKINFGLTK